MMNEYCDNGQCPAQARVSVFTRRGPLFLCGHHFRRHCAALEPFAFGAYGVDAAFMQLQQHGCGNHTKNHLIPAGPV